MVSKQTDPGYERAISAVKEQQGIDRGAASWLASELGVGRQHVFYWSKSGFPDDVIPRVAKILKMPRDCFFRGRIRLEIPRDAWDEICTEVRKSLTDQATIL